ncbi:MAG: hypothetical protein AAGG38_10280 [Planctomycetota bacterium]
MMVGGAGAVGATGGCAAVEPVERVWPTIERALPLGGGEVVAAVEPFAEVMALGGGETYLAIGEAVHRERGAWLSVNGGDWTVSATVGRGDRVDVAYTRSPAGRPGAGTLSYEVLGPTLRGCVRLIEKRWYLDGYPARERLLRVWPYPATRAAHAER